MSYKVFVIGKSRSGKTTFAKEFCKKFKFQHIQASEWIKRLHPELKPDMPNYREEITKKSIKCLQENPWACISFIQMEFTYKLPSFVNGSLIEGIRNPYDFHRLYDPQKDYVIFLRTSFIDEQQNSFDRGVDAIYSSVEFLRSNRLILETQVIEEYFNVDHGSIFEQATSAMERYELTDQKDLFRLEY